MMSASNSPASEGVEGKKDCDELKKSSCTSPTPFAGPSSRKDEEKSTFRGSESKAKFDVEHLKKIRISFSFKKRQTSTTGSGETFDPSLIAPVRRPDFLDERPTRIIEEQKIEVSSTIQEGSVPQVNQTSEGKVPIFSRLTTVNQGDENGDPEPKKSKPEEKDSEAAVKPSVSSSRGTRPRSLSRSRRPTKRHPDYYREREEYLRLKKEHILRQERHRKLRRSRHRSRSRSPSSSDSDSSSGSERSRSSRSRSRGRRRSEGRSRTRSRSRDRRRRERSHDRSRDIRRPDDSHHSSQEMVPYHMAPGHWIAPRQQFPPPFPMFPGPMYPYPPFRPHLPPFHRPPRIMNRRS